MTSPPDPGTVPVVSFDDWGDNVWASSSSSSRHPNFTPSVTNMPPSTTRSSHTLHRRRTSENPSAISRTKIIHLSRAESSDNVRGHPLRRDSSGPSSSSFNDLTATRPILNLWLSPGPTADGDKNPLEGEHETKTDSGEKEELVLIHEVSFFSLGARRSSSARNSNWTNISGYCNRLASGCITKVRHFNG